MVKVQSMHNYWTHNWQGTRDGAIYKLKGDHTHRYTTFSQNFLSVFFLSVGGTISRGWGHHLPTAPVKIWFQLIATRWNHRWDTNLWTSLQNRSSPLRIHLSSILQLEMANLDSAMVKMAPRVAQTILFGLQESAQISINIWGSSLRRLPLPPSQ